MGFLYIAQLVKNLPAMQEPWVQFLGWEDPLEKDMTNPLRYSCLENPMDRGAWQANVHGVVRARHNLATKPPHQFNEFWFPGCEVLYYFGFVE